MNKKVVESGNAHTTRCDAARSHDPQRAMLEFTSTTSTRSSTSNFSSSRSFRVFKTIPPNPIKASKKRPLPHSKSFSVSILHSKTFTNTLYQNLHHIHQDRDMLYSSLLYHCGFIKERPKCIHLVSPKKAVRRNLESFHDSHYLDLLECYDNFGDHEGQDDIINMDFSTDAAMQSILDKYGLTDDCPIPPSTKQRSQLWDYCLSIAGSSIHAAELLLTGTSNHVAINFGGGRHHAHPKKAGGFCYINDVVLAIQRFLKENNENSCPNRDHGVLPQERLRRRVLYLDLDIHHCDGVQSAFYDSDQVLTISLHRYTPGFFPSTSGSIKEKGKHQTKGVGYNLNIPMPKSCTNVDFIDVWKRILKQVLPHYDPDFVVICVGADGLRDDDLVKDTCEGWNLTPEGIAICVKLLALQCAGHRWEDISCPNEIKKELPPMTEKKRKLLVLGGGGYNPTNTARTFLLCTAAACEGARPGILDELPTDIPKHEYFARYGPSFELYSKETTSSLQCGDQQQCRYTILNNDIYTKTLYDAKEAINLQEMFLWKNKLQEEKTNETFHSSVEEDFDQLLTNGATQNKKGNSRRKRKRKVCTI